MAMAVVHRALRIWPAFIISLMIFANLTEYLSSGIQAFQLKGVNCSEWWINVFFLTYETSNDCFGWGW